MIEQVNNNSRPKFQPAVELGRRARGRRKIISLEERDARRKRMEFARKFRRAEKNHSTEVFINEVTPN